MDCMDNIDSLCSKNFYIRCVCVSSRDTKAKKKKSPRITMKWKRNFIIAGKEFRFHFGKLSHIVHSDAIYYRLLLDFVSFLIDSLYPPPPMDVSVIIIIHSDKVNQLHCREISENFEGENCLTSEFLWSNKFCR